MTHSKILNRILGGFLTIATIATITFSGCTKVNDSLGSDLTLENQALKLGQIKFSGLTDGGNNYFVSRLYKTDSLNSAGLGAGYLGTMGNDTFGMRQAGFYSQYLTAFKIDEDIFGHMPIFDSAMLYLSLAGYGGDTTQKQKFEIYEVIDDSFITESDSIFFPTFDAEPYLAKAPVFTFTFPDQDRKIYTSTSAIKLDQTPLTEEFINRLMLETKSGDYTYEIYEDQEEWLKYFKGLYIRPVEDLPSTDGTSTGAIYKFTLSSTGFGFYGRSREEKDPTLIKDTIGMTYSFYSQYAEHGNISINTISHNYDGSLIDESLVKTPDNKESDDQITSTLRVEGMSGVVSQITFAKEFFEQLDTILATEEAESGEAYTSLFFNQAKLRIYMQEVNGYDPAAINPFLVTKWLNYLPSKLGLYTNYSNYLYTSTKDENDRYMSLTGVADYVYSYESSYTLDFDGSLNRSWCCYVMNVSSYIQTLWNSYLVAKQSAEDKNAEINWDDVAYRTVYLAPTATDLFAPYYASLQAGEASNTAPMQLELTYTMTR